MDISKVETPTRYMYFYVCCRKPQAINHIDGLTRACTSPNFIKNRQPKTECKIGNQIDVCYYTFFYVHLRLRLSLPLPLRSLRCSPYTTLIYYYTDSLWHSSFFTIYKIVKPHITTIAHCKIYVRYTCVRCFVVHRHNHNTITYEIERYFTL